MKRQHEHRDDVTVYVCAVSLELSYQDRTHQEIAGIYQVTVDPFASDDLAGAALDAFFNHVKVIDCDSFRYDVINTEGRQLNEGDDYTCCSYHGRCAVRKVSGLCNCFPLTTLQVLVVNAHRSAYAHA